MPVGWGSPHLQSPRLGCRIPRQVSDAHVSVTRQDERDDSRHDSEGGASPTLRPEHAGNIAPTGACRVPHCAYDALPASRRVDGTRARCLAVFRARGCLAPLPSPSSTRGADTWYRSHRISKAVVSTRARRPRHTLPAFSGVLSASVVRASRPHFIPLTAGYLGQKSFTTSPVPPRPLSIAMSAMKSVAIREIRVPIAMARKRERERERSKVH